MCGSWPQRFPAPKCAGHKTVTIPRVGVGGPSPLRCVGSLVSAFLLLLVYFLLVEEYMFQKLPGIWCVGDKTFFWELTCLKMFSFYPSSWSIVWLWVEFLVENHLPLASGRHLAPPLQLLGNLTRSISCFLMTCVFSLETCRILSVSIVLKFSLRRTQGWVYFHPLGWYFLSLNSSPSGLGNFPDYLRGYFPLLLCLCSLFSITGYD